MTALDTLKMNIMQLYKSNPNIHVNISVGHPKINLKGDPALIIGVYPHIFRIEEYSDGTPKCHTVRYTDVLTNQIEIVELNRD